MNYITRVLVCSFVMLLLTNACHSITTGKIRLAKVDDTTMCTTSRTGEDVYYYKYTETMLPIDLKRLRFPESFYIGRRQSGPLENEDYSATQFIDTKLSKLWMMDAVFQGSNEGASSALESLNPSLVQDTSEKVKAGMKIYTYTDNGSVYRVKLKWGKCSLSDWIYIYITIEPK